MENPNEAIVKTEKSGSATSKDENGDHAVRGNCNTKTNGENPKLSSVNVAYKVENADASNHANTIDSSAKDG